MSSGKKYVQKGDDSVERCWWGNGSEDYAAYHDNEWGYPVDDDYRLFEKICLEGFQSGLSWITILRKREGFRKAFKNFDFYKVADYSVKDVEKLLQNSAIVRHRGKIEATINNAKCAIEIAKEYGSLAAYIWSFEPTTKEPHAGKKPAKFPSETKTSQRLSKELKKKGWKFFGPTTAYAFMQAMGLVNDHQEGCFCFQKAIDLRKQFTPPTYTT